MPVTDVVIRDTYVRDIVILTKFQVVFQPHRDQTVTAQQHPFLLS